MWKRLRSRLTLFSSWLQLCRHDVTEALAMISMMPYRTYYTVEHTYSWQAFQEHQYPLILELHLIVCLVAGSQLGVCCIHGLWVRHLGDHYCRSAR